MSSSEMAKKGEKNEHHGGTLIAGSVAAMRRVQRQVSAAARGQMCAEYIVDFHIEIIQGRDPRVTLRDIDPATNHKRMGRPSYASNVIEQIPSLQESMVAMQQLLLRRDGQAPRKEDLDREVAAESSKIGSMNAERLAAMGPNELRILVDTLRRATGAPEGVGSAQTDSAGPDQGTALALVEDEDRSMLTQDPEAVEDEGTQDAQADSRPQRPVIDV